MKHAETKVSSNTRRRKCDENFLSLYRKEFKKNFKIREGRMVKSEEKRTGFPGRAGE